MTVFLCVRLVLFSNCSLRSAAAVMREVSAVHSMETPSHTTIQNWVLKCGVAHLADGAERRDDWIFILDHTVEFGTKKCLLVLGVPRDGLRKGRCAAKHEDAVVLAIHLSDKTSSDDIKAVLSKDGGKGGDAHPNRLRPWTRHQKSRRGIHQISTPPHRLHLRHHAQDGSHPQARSRGRRRLAGVRPQVC